MWIMMVKNFQFIQQKQAQCDFAGSDIDKSTLQPFVFEKFIFTGYKLFYCNRNVFKKTLALNCQLYSTNGPSCLVSSERMSVTRTRF